MFFLFTYNNELLSQDRGNPGWYLRVTPYLWFSSLGGAESLGAEPGETISGDYKMHLDNEEFEKDWALSLELGKSRVRALINIYSGGLHNSGHAMDFNDHDIDIPVSYDLSWFTSEIFTAIQLGPFKEQVGFETYFGLRYVSQDLDIIEDVSQASLSNSASWVEPVLGGRLYTTPGKRMSTMFYTDFGGFGAGSEYTWTLGGEIGIKISKPLNLCIRYQYQEIQYDNGKTDDTRYIWNTGVQQGWFIGGAIQI